MFKKVFLCDFLNHILLRKLKFYLLYMKLSIN